VFPRPGQYTVGPYVTGLIWLVVSFKHALQNNNLNVLSFTVATAPAITGCPLFVGPEVINRTQIEFYCDVITNATDPRSRFNVYFLFNAQVDAGVPVQVVDLTKLRATLHERYLAGRLNKAVRYEECSINKLQNGIILLMFIIMKNPKYAFCREYYSEYQMWVLFWWGHCDVIYRHKMGDVAIQSIP